MPVPAYVAISDPQVAAEAPITTGLMTALRDNLLAAFGAGGGAGIPLIVTGAITDLSVTTPKLADAAVTSIKIGSALKQSNLDSSQGTVSVTPTAGADGNVTLPGGEYGFYPEIAMSGSGGTLYNVIICARQTSIANAGRVGLSFISGGSPTTLTAKQRYINASPPYNLGDGDIPLFVFVSMKGKNITGIYIAQDPPWAHNGPTRICPDFYRQDTVTGIIKGYQRKIITDFSMKDVRSGKMTMAEYAKKKKEAKVEVIEVDHSIKNADLDIIPHPFPDAEVNKEKVFLLDPVNTLPLLELHHSGESISDLIMEGHIQIGSPVIRKCHRSVTPVFWSWR